MTHDSVLSTAFVAGPDVPVPAGWSRTHEIGAGSGRHVVFDPAVHDVSVLIGVDATTERTFERLGFVTLLREGALSVRVRARSSNALDGHNIDASARACARLSRPRPESGLVHAEPGL